MEMKIKIVKRAQLEENRLVATMKSQVAVEVKRFKAPRTEKEARFQWQRLFNFNEEEVGNG